MDCRIEEAVNYILRLIFRFCCSMGIFESRYDNRPSSESEIEIFSINNLYKIYLPPNLKIVINQCLL